MTIRDNYNSRSPTSTDNPTQLIDTECDLATDLLGDITTLTSSLDPVTSRCKAMTTSSDAVTSRSRSVRSSGDLTDSEYSLSPIQENTFCSRDDDVFISPRSYAKQGMPSNLRDEKTDDVIKTNEVVENDEVKLNGEDCIYEEGGCGFQGTLDTGTIKVDLETEIQAISQDIVVK